MVTCVALNPLSGYFGRFDGVNSTCARGYWEQTTAWQMSSIEKKLSEPESEFANLKVFSSSADMPKELLVFLMFFLTTQHCNTQTKLNTASNRTTTQPIKY